MTRDHCFESCDKIDDKVNIRNIQIKYMIIIILKYTRAKNAPFIVQYCINYNKININH